MGEGYIRPPLFAREPGSRRVAAWRLRIVMAAVVAGLVLLLFLIFRSHTPGDSQNPGVGLGSLTSAAAERHVDPGLGATVAM